MRNYKTPMFQQRHYEALAHMLAMGIANDAVVSKTTIIMTLQRMFKADNPKFQPQRFFDAATKKVWEGAKGAENDTKRP